MRNIQGSRYVPKRTKADKLTVIQYERSIESPLPLALGETTPVFEIESSLKGLWEDNVKLHKLIHKLKEKKRKPPSPLTISSSFPKTRRVEDVTLDEGPELSASSPFEKDRTLLSDEETKGV